MVNSNFERSSRPDINDNERRARGAPALLEVGSPSVRGDTDSSVDRHR